MQVNRAGKKGTDNEFPPLSYSSVQQFETGGNSKSVPIFPTPAPWPIFFTASDLTTDGVCHIVSKKKGFGLMGIVVGSWVSGEVVGLT